MTPVQRPALIGVALLIGVVGLAVLSRERVPEYSGRDARAWFRQYQSSPGAGPLELEAQDAFAAMSDAAVPFLWRVINQPQPGRVGRAWAWLKARWPWGAASRSRGGPQRPPPFLAIQLMYHVRPSEAALWPLIQPALNDPGSPRYFTALQVAGTLGTGGTNAVPALVKALESTNRVVVTVALQSLAMLGRVASDAVPALIRALDGPQLPRALRVLGAMGPAARPAIPRIERLGDAALRNFPGYAAVALCRIDPSHPAMKSLIAGAADRHDLLRASGSITALGEIGPAAKPALPVLLAALAEPLLAMPAAQAIHSVDPCNPDAVPLLLKYLRGGDLNAASWLARWEPTHEAGIAALGRLIESDPQEGQRLWAMYVLYEVGPRARAAIPALEAASRHPSATVRDAARCTLQQVRGKR